MSKTCGLYYLGATVVTREVLARVQRYSNRVLGIFGLDSKHLAECHVTIVPPFYADFRIASRINLSCAAATLLSEHPLVTTLFFIRGMSVMSFNDIHVLHFKVGVYNNNELPDHFTQYVKTLRKKFAECGLLFKEDVPDEFMPHITVHMGKDIGYDVRLKKIITGSQVERPLYFKSGYPTLYARYKNDWRDLRNDPTTI